MLCFDITPIVITTSECDHFALTSGYIRYVRYRNYVHVRSDELTSCSHDRQKWRGASSKCQRKVKVARCQCDLTVYKVCRDTDNKHNYHTSMIFKQISASASQPDQLCQIKQPWTPRVHCLRLRCQSRLPSIPSTRTKQYVYMPRWCPTHRIRSQFLHGQRSSTFAMLKHARSPGAIFTVLTSTTARP